jgi:hypothetical protein
VPPIISVGSVHVIAVNKGWVFVLLQQVSELKLGMQMDSRNDLRSARRRHQLLFSEQLFNGEIVLIELSACALVNGGVGSASSWCRHVLNERFLMEDLNHLDSRCQIVHVVVNLVKYADERAEEVEETRPLAPIRARNQAGEIGKVMVINEYILCGAMLPVAVAWLLRSKQTIVPQRFRSAADELGQTSSSHISTLQTIFGGISGAGSARLSSHRPICPPYISQGRTTEKHIMMKLSENDTKIPSSTRATKKAASLASKRNSVSCDLEEVTAASLL